MYDIEKITQATSVAHAISCLEQDPAALILAGGSDLLVQIREGRHAGKHLVSIHGLPELSGITQEADGTIVLGPLSTFAQVTQSPLVEKHIPTLGYATDQAGGPQLRNIGTLGGNVCNGVTSADSASTLLTLNAQLEITGPAGVRRVPLAEFYAGPGKVHLQPAEVLTALRIAKEDYENYYGCYIKYAQRNAMDIATLSCAVHVKLTADKTAVDQLRLAFGVAAPTPIRCYETEKKAQGLPIGPQLYETVSQGALGEVTPRTSWRATKEFREQLVRELSRRALQESITKAGGTA